MTRRPSGQPEFLVIGGGIAGMLAARRAARRGVRVLLVEATDQLGGMIRSAQLGGLTIDIGAEAFATRGGAFAALLEELGMLDGVVEPRALGSWVVTDETAAPMPAGGMLGIPGEAALLDDEARAAVHAAIGDEGIAELERDRELAPEIGADAVDLEALVLARMGPVVLGRLVAPVTRGVYSLDPAELDHRVLLPALAERIREHGSLAGAVAALRRNAPPGAAVRTVDGGMHLVVARLGHDLEELGVEIRLGTRVVSAAEVSVSDLPAPDGSTAGGATAGREYWRVVLEHGEPLVVPRILSTIELPAPGLAGASAPGGAAPVPAEVVALLVRAPQLDQYPRGTGVLVGEPSTSIRAKALTHVTAKWAWQQAAAGEGMHVLRLSYGPERPGGAEPLTHGLDDDQLKALACTDAGRLLGTAISDDDDVVAVARHVWRIPAPAARLGRAEALKEARDGAKSAEGFALAGTWIDGTGLASVVPGVLRAVDELFPEDAQA
ncbi:protoporphyrinogen oxidase [Pseudoclavibacter sp. AY1F1]|uniref:protoporphyrinogen/coproporphyrinogen oxidase n=1 Tax=Pseudoclavibacter sp. AY1F1 TaxID=2080583 RepID=UPI000CE7A4AD|nr:FAD-dependent oxidoreductase [Pseudoclavibacter sp. AY1F1]PPF45205.1 protoporphyrinogen oxidase [Pseudoclavibacter sp. AY1F1]